MSVTRSENLLLVEGPDDQAVVLHLCIRRGLIPGKRGAGGVPPFDIQVKLQRDEILQPKKLRPFLLQSGATRLGVLLDAERSGRETYEGFRGALLGLASGAVDVPGLPESLPAEGLVCEGAGNLRRLGLFLLPDCQSDGSLEDLLHDLVPTDGRPPLGFALECTRRAKKEHSAPFGDTDSGVPRGWDEVQGTPAARKAVLHTWLAWQKSPGEQYGMAIKQKLLGDNSPRVTALLAWICRLFELPEPLS